LAQADRLDPKVGSRLMLRYINQINRVNSCAGIDIIITYTEKKHKCAHITLHWPSSASRCIFIHHFQGKPKMASFPLFLVFLAIPWHCQCDHSF